MATHARAQLKTQRSLRDQTRAKQLNREQQGPNFNTISTIIIEEGEVKGEEEEEE